MELRRQKVYSRYEIGLIMYFWTMVGFLPMVLIVSYMLDLHLKYNPNYIILTILGVNFLLCLIGGLILFLQKNKLKRQVKTHYRAEYIYIVFVSGFSILGSVVLFDYLNGNRDYIANILVFLSAVVFVLLAFFGRKYFKLNYISRK
jgi:lysylphosphatidylglycerol synthetase-like protein (DUF2156 family)